MYGEAVEFRGAEFLALVATGRFTATVDAGGEPVQVEQIIRLRRADFAGTAEPSRFEPITVRGKQLAIEEIRTDLLTGDFVLSLVNADLGNVWPSIT